jgi:transcriptional regulator of acetoin/glycerol metabolism
VHEGDPLTREIIETSLLKARGNISRAAHSLGLSRQAFYRRMERFGLKT